MLNKDKYVTQWQFLPLSVFTVRLIVVINRKYRKYKP